MAMYGKVEYWDERYSSASPPSYEWYQNYGQLSHLLSMEALITTTRMGAPITTFPPRESCRVLILGCGNSNFAGDMVLDGWKGKITNIDFSAVVIEQMKTRFGSDFCDKFHCPQMEFVCADVAEGLPFDDESFDLVICKGTFDAILCSSGSVANAKRIVSECSRVLVKGHGIFFLVTHGNPDSRVVFLEHDNDVSYYWQEVTYHPVGTGPKNQFVYVCRKNSEELVYPKKKLLSLKNDENEDVENIAIDQPQKTDDNSK